MFRDRVIVSAHQPHYLPWLRYIHKIASADTFVILDNIQFNDNGWQKRNKIKTPQGPLILSLPIIHKFHQRLDEVAIDANQPWQRKHWKAIQRNYQRAPFFKEHEAFFSGLYEKPWLKLNDIVEAMLLYVLQAMGIKTRIVKSSDLAPQGEATERLVGICKALGAGAYLTGEYAAQAYLDSELFRREGIGLLAQKFECPEYPQLYPEAGFIPELSILDLLFNCGPKSLEILMGGRSSRGQAYIEQVPGLETRHPSEACPFQDRPLEDRPQT